MHAYTPEAAQAIEGSAREFTHRLMVDWNNNGQYNHPLSDMSQYVERTVRDQAITSTAPDELMLIEGYAAASLDIETSGEYEGLSLVGHFAPYNGRSIFYTEGLSLGVAMYYEIAVWTDNGWEWFRQFTGVVREVELNREDDRVTLHCLDNAEKMRTPVNIPPYGMYKDYLINGFKRAQLVDSSSLIDLAGRSAGFSSSPLGFSPEDKTGWQTVNNTWGSKIILDVPFHGSHLPQVGFFDNQFEFHLTEEWEQDTALQPYAEQFRDGPHGYLALQGVPPGKETWGVKNYWCDLSDFYYNDDPWGSTFFTAWIYWPGPTGANNPNRSTDVVTINTQLFDAILRVESWDGGVNVLIRRRSDGVELWGNWSSLPAAPGWYNIGAAFSFQPSSTTTMKLQCWVDGNYTSVKDTGWDPPGLGEYALNGLVTVRNHYALSDLQILRTAYHSWLGVLAYNYSSRGNADLSWGRNRVTYTLREEETEAWELAKAVAAAEYGTVFFDEHGTFKFWTYDDVHSLQGTASKQLTVDEVSGLSLRITMDSVRNVWQVTSKTGYSDFGIVYDFRRDDVPYIRQGKNTYRAKFELPSSGVPTEFWVQDGPNVMCPQPTMFRSAAGLIWNDFWPQIDYKPYQSTTYQDQDLNIYIRKHDRNWTSLKVQNPWTGTTIGFVGPDDQRFFRIGGTFVTEDPERTWTYSTDDRAREASPSNPSQAGPYAQSIARYGRRVIELGNKWVQDEFQTREMLRNVMERYGRPTPVTDAITVPGDPRVQLGDCIDIRDTDGLGGLTRLQILGINRELENGVGLKDTYQVEVIEVPGTGRWDDQEYGLWDQSLIWS